MCLKCFGLSWESGAKVQYVRESCLESCIARAMSIEVNRRVHDFIRVHLLGFLEIKVKKT